NIFRNARRSITTMLTIAIGVTAILVFAAWMFFSTHGLQTQTVQGSGHLTVYRNGYFNYGSGAPSLWGIDDYPTVLALIREDPVIKPLLSVATPTQSLAGIVANSESDTSKTFF